MTKEFRPDLASELNELSPGMDIKHALLDETLYDTRYFIANKNVGASHYGNLEFFKVPKFGVEGVCNDESLQYKKNEIQTNLNLPRRLERGVIFQLESIGVLISGIGISNLSKINSEEFLTGMVAQYSTLNAAGVEHLRQIVSKSFKLTSHIGVMELEAGLVEAWPIEFEDDAGLTFDDHLKNNSVVMRQLKLPRLIQPKQEFYIRLQPLKDFIPDYNFEIKMSLKGTYFRNFS